MNLLMSHIENEADPLKYPSTVWQLVLYTEDILTTGEYQFQVVIELANYPTSTPAIADFAVIIDPCIVTELTAPADLNVTYWISPEAEMSTIEYNFA